MKDQALIGGASLIIAFLLFVIMQLMIKPDMSLFSKKGDHAYLNFVRVKPTDQMIETKDRKLPDEPPPPEQPPSAPEMTVPNDAAPAQSTPQLSMKMPSMAMPINASGGPVIGTPGASGGGNGLGQVGVMDADVVALLKVPAKYPRKAKVAKIEGYVKLKIVIRPDGTVSTAKVIESKPKRLFDKAAKDAVLRYKFKAKIIDGVPVKQTATQVIEFKLSK